MRQFFKSFYARISTIFLLLIVVLGAGWVAIAFNSARQLFSAVEQVLNREYARSIAAEIQPLVAGGFDEGRVRGAIHYMMVLNPMVEIYLLDRGRKDPGLFHRPHGPRGAKLRRPPPGQELHRLGRRAPHHGR